MLRRLLAPLLRRGRVFGRDQRGVTAIEFAILALPFFTLIFAIIETAVVFLASQILDSSVQDAARLIRTGQSQTAKFEMDEFRAAMCANLYGMFDCDKIWLTVNVVSNFASAELSSPSPDASSCTATSCEWTLDEIYDDGIGGSVVLVEAYYRWPVIVNLPGFNLQNQPDGKRLLAAVRVFRNEPFSVAGS